MITLNYIQEIIFKLAYHWNCVRVSQSDTRDIGLPFIAIRISYAIYRELQEIPRYVKVVTLSLLPTDLFT